jgi:hypothetical protein
MATATHQAERGLSQTMPAVSIVEVALDIFGGTFGKPSWRAWMVVLKALFALAMDAEELDLFTKLTGRGTPPTAPAREGWWVIGRRGGKSLIAALIVVYLAFFRSYRDVLASGEMGTVMLISPDRRQSRVEYRYITGLVDNVPMLKAMVARRTADSIYLTNGIVIEIHTASFRTVRGYTVVAAVMDECAFYHSDEQSANPDVEILNALRPATATVPGALILGISSPYARRGILWNAYAARWGKDGDILVIRADTRTMNPTVPEAIIQAALEEDEPAARAEYYAEFRQDLETFIPRELVEDAVVLGRRSLPPQPDVHYVGFTDTAAGPSEHTDSMTVGIAHRAGNRLILDLLRERKPPFSTEDVTQEFAAALREYGITTVVGDRYGSQWPVERFRAHGLRYEASDRPKSELYRDFLALMTGRRVELLDDARLVGQLVRLERRVSGMGRESITHPPQSHDDLANAAAGALVFAAGRRPGRPAFTGYAEALAREEAAWAAAHPAPAPGEWRTSDLQLGCGVLAPRSTLSCSSCGRPDDQASGWLLTWGSATCPACAQGRRQEEV